MNPFILEQLNGELLVLNVERSQAACLVQSVLLYNLN